MLTSLYVLISVILVSLCSLVGIFSLLLKQKYLEKILLFLVSLSAGSLIGGAFLHIIPEAVEKNGLTLSLSLSIIGGILFFFILEKFIHWRHCHVPTSDHHHHHLAVMNLVGDGIHNFIDGVIIAVSYLASVPTGIATTMAVVLHEVPQEIGDFGVLIYSGLSKWKALFYNFISASIAILGAVIGLIIGSRFLTFIDVVLPFAAGGFIYIAGVDLIPELHKECEPKNSLWQFLALLLGIFIIYALRFLE